LRSKRAIGSGSETAGIGEGLIDGAVRSKYRAALQELSPKGLNMGITQSIHPATLFEMRFDSLSDAGRALALPCDEAGRIDLDAMSEPVRNSYFYARAMRGWQYAATPRVVPRKALDRGKGGSPCA